MMKILMRLQGWVLEDSLEIKVWIIGITEGEITERGEV